MKGLYVGQNQISVLKYLLFLNSDGLGQDMRFWYLFYVYKRPLINVYADVSNGARILNFGL